MILAGMLGRLRESVMSSGRVRVDPEFDARPERDSGRRIPWFMIVLLVVAAGLFGWLMAAPVPTDVDDPAVAVPSVPTPTVEVVDATTTSVAAEAPLVTPRSSMVTGIGESLSDAIPGFTDEVVMLATPPESFRVIRWHPAEDTPKLTLSLDRIAEYGCVPVGLDASGTWFARVRRDNSLVVQPVNNTPGERSRPENVGLNVTSVVWHETVPGSLAWISCARSESGPATLSTLDVSDPDALPEPVRTIGHNCEGGVWLEAWTEEGLLLGDSRGSPGDPDNQILIVPGGTDTIVRSAHPWLVDDPSDRYLRAIPGVSHDEPVRDAAASPNGSFSAVILDDFWDDEFATLRIADSETGQPIIEVTQHGFDVVTMAWSTNGRFLLYELWNFDAETGELAVYDTTTGTTTHIPVAEIADEIRTTRPQ